VHKSICPYCAVGCGQNVHVKDGESRHRSDEDSPVSRGRLCPKARDVQLVTGKHRLQEVLYRAGGTSWERIPLQQAMRMVATRVFQHA